MEISSSSVRRKSTAPSARALSFAHDHSIGRKPTELARMMRSRIRVFTVCARGRAGEGDRQADELVELFRKAIPCEQALWKDVVDDRRALRYEQHVEALDAVHAFDRAAGKRSFEFSALHPRGEGPLQAALFAKLTEDEVKAWRDWWRKDYPGVDRPGSLVTDIFQGTKR